MIVIILFGIIVAVVVPAIVVPAVVSVVVPQVVAAVVPPVAEPQVTIPPLRRRRRSSTLEGRLDGLNDALDGLLDRLQGLESDQHETLATLGDRDAAVRHRRMVARRLHVPG